MQIGWSSPRLTPAITCGVTRPQALAVRCMALFGAPVSVKTKSVGMRTPLHLRSLIILDQDERPVFHLPVFGEIEARFRRE